MWVAFGFGSCPGSGYGLPTHVNGSQAEKSLFPTPFYCFEKCLDSEKIKTPLVLKETLYLFGNIH